MEKWRQCSSSDLSPVAMIDCISQAIVPSCRSCICTLFCYWSPTGDLCKSCLDQPQLASLFLHHQHCPQGWVYSEASSSCLKTFNREKPWSFAKSFCENGGGALAQPKTTSTIQAVLEAVNLLGEAGLHWLGGQETQPQRCNPADNNLSCCSSTYPCNLGEGHCDSDDECAGNLVCGQDNCGAGDYNMDCCTTTDGNTTTVGMEFLWVGDNFMVESSNWAQGFPVSDVNSAGE